MCILCNNCSTINSTCHLLLSETIKTTSGTRKRGKPVPKQRLAAVPVNHRRGGSWVAPTCRRKHVRVNELQCLAWFDKFPHSRPWRVGWTSLVDASVESCRSFCVIYKRNPTLFSDVGTREVSVFLLSERTRYPVKSYT